MDINSLEGSEADGLDAAERAGIAHLRKVCGSRPIKSIRWTRKDRRNNRLYVITRRAGGIFWIISDSLVGCMVRSLRRPIRMQVGEFLMEYEPQEGGRQWVR